METSTNISKAQEMMDQGCVQTSPSSNSSSGSSGNGVPPLTPKTLTRSDQPPNNNNNATTTFVQADTSSFKQVVQMLTGSSDTTAKAKHLSSSRPVAAASDPPKISIPPIRTGPRKPGFKLYERRNSGKSFKISPVMANSPYSPFSPRNHEILSPSILDIPSLALSPVTPLIPDPFNRYGTPSAEDKAIAERGFYLHPSPRTTPRDPSPRLLPLFPVTSPRLSGSSSS